MSAPNSEEQSKDIDIISAIYNEIESKKNLISQLKENYYPPQGDFININAAIFNDILEEFEVTITHSLQAIQTLQTELWNIKEKYLQDDYKNYDDSNLNKQNLPLENITEENNFNNTDNNTDNDNINNNVTSNLDNNPNSQSNRINKSQTEDPSRLYYDYSQISNFNYYMLSDKNFKKNIQLMEEQKMQNNNSPMIDNDNNQNINNLIAQTPEVIPNNQINNQINSQYNNNQTNNQNFSQINNQNTQSIQNIKNKIKQMKQNIQENNLNKGPNHPPMFVSYSQQDMCKNINKPMTRPIVKKVKNKEEEEEKHIKTMKENLLVKNHSNSNMSHCNTYNPYPIIKGAYQKLDKNKSISAKNLMSRNNININKMEELKSKIITNDYDCSMKNNASEMIQNIEVSSSQEKLEEQQQQLMKELNNQGSLIINPKVPIRQSIRQIIQTSKLEKKQKEEEIMKKTKEEHRQNIQNQKLKFLLEKISKVETYRTYFGDKYGDGNYKVFLDKLNNNQIQMDTLEDELLIIADLMANQINAGQIQKEQSNNNIQNLQEEPVEANNVPIPYQISNTNPNINNPNYNNTNFKTNMNTIDVPEKYKNIYPYNSEKKIYSNNNRNISKDKKYKVENRTFNTSNPYVEPVKFDTFLRQNERNDKTKRRMNFGLGKK